MKVLLARPRGFCAGVDRAIMIVERALAVFGPPVYVRHEIVHNRFVVEDLRAKGAVFVEGVGEIPEGAVAIFSAHGVAPAVREAAAKRNLRMIDATCPLVTKVHHSAQRHATEGATVLLIGHAGHPEVEGTCGHAPDRIVLVQNIREAETVDVEDPSRLFYVTQTTLSVEDVAEIVGVLRRRFPSLKGPARKDICYATQNRQQAVKQLAKRARRILVIGSSNSSNANRLREVAEREGAEALLVESAAVIDPEWVKGAEVVGIASGASTPEHLVEEMVARLKEIGAEGVEEMDGIEENVHFPLPEIGE